MSVDNKIVTLTPMSETFTLKIKTFRGSFGWFFCVWTAIL